MLLKDISIGEALRAYVRRPTLREVTQTLYITCRIWLASNTVPGGRMTGDDT